MKKLNRKLETPLRWDERTWQVLPPLTSIDDFSSIEVPGLTLEAVEIKGRHYLFFALSLTETHQPTYSTSVYYMVADKPDGPFSQPRMVFSTSGYFSLNCQL